MLTSKPRSFQSKCVRETGLSDFHRMTISVLKMHFRKLPPKVINYRDFKKFDYERFMNSLQYTLNEERIDYSQNPDRFFEISHTVLNTYAPKKKKYIRGNNKTFMTKTFSKAIMQRIRFRNKFLKNLTDQNKLTYNRKRNFCVSLLRNEKKEYFAILNEKDITDNRKFWHTVKPFLSDKVKSRETITLANNGNIESNENEAAKTFNDFFSNIVKNLRIPEYLYEDNLHNRLSNHPALQAILKYRNHPSINNIRNSSQRLSSFYFSQIDTNTILKEIRRLSAKKAVQDTDISVKVLTENAEFLAEQTGRQFNEAISSSKFPTTFKFGNVTSVFKQGTRNLKDNYRSTNILPIISKIFEKLICR